MAELRDLGELSRTLNAEGSTRLSIPDYASGIPRTPFIITTEELLLGKKRLTTGAQYIYLNANPNEVSFQQGIRGAEQKIRGGSIQHVWKDRNTRNTFMDELVLGFQFQAGNTMPVILNDKKDGILGTSTDTRISPGLENFYEMIEILDQDRVLDDGRPNFVYIQYNSRNFPQLTLVGFFEPQGYSWTDSADNPSSLTWTANFIVYESFPKFNNAGELRRIFELYGMRSIKGTNDAAGSIIDTTGIPNALGGLAPEG